jgi:hypothetical protein
VWRSASIRMVRKALIRRVKMYVCIDQLAGWTADFRGGSHGRGEKASAGQTHRAVFYHLAIMILLQNEEVSRRYKKGRPVLQGCLTPAGVRGNFAGFWGED